MIPPASVSRNRRISASPTSGPRMPHMSRRPPRVSSVMASGVHQVRPPRGCEARQRGPPRSLHPRDGHPALDGAPDPVVAAEDVDGQPAPLELVRRAAPAEAPAPLAARLGDQVEI